MCAIDSVVHQVEIVEYRNFELGVFFHASKERGTEYLAIRPDCPVHGGYCRGEGNDLNFARSRNCSDRKCVMLPVPYDLCGGEKYYSADSAVFHYSPYLNKADEVLAI